MTTGQRIASKRKELKLSQEGLGEQLGVSRQSIYKWESDTSLPEIDKLVAMSRLFGVSVGWLLGVEEEKTPPETPGADDGELTDRQIKMVEEIVDRYVAAQPKAKKRRRWPWLLVGGVLCVALFSLFSRLDQLDSRYNNLQNSIGNISSSVNREIGTITNRVEEILKAQNDLTADYGCEILGADLARNTITFTVYATPKTYVSGMQVEFLADIGTGEVTIFPAAEDQNHRFSAQVTTTLTDSISISAVFISGDTRQTQLLDNFGGLYGASFPNLDLSGLESCLMYTKRRSDGTFLLPLSYGWLRERDSHTKLGPVEIQQVKAALFKNFQLVTWLAPCAPPDKWDIESEHYFLLDEMSIELESGDLLSFAAIVTDEYGRQSVVPCIPAFECMGDEISWMSSSDATPFFDLENYVLDEP